MTTRHLLRALSSALLMAAALLLVMSLAGCDVPGYLDGSFAYTVEPHADGLTASIHDQRSGTHTTWIVATNPPADSYPIWLQVTGEGDVEVDRSVELPAGTYSYVVRSAEGSVALGDDTWQSGDVMGRGEVTVP